MSDLRLPLHVNSSRRYTILFSSSHNHGTETSDEPSYHTGNADDFAFGHIGFLVNDVYTTCDKLEKAGVKFHKKPDGGTMKGLAFALDPDGYRIELIKRGWKPPF